MSLYSVVRNDIRANGAIITIDSPTGNTVALDIRGTFVGTLQFESTIDGINWFAAAAIPLPFTQGSAVVSSTTAPGAWLVNSAGTAQSRIRASAWTSGNASIVARTTEDDNNFTLPTGTGITTVNSTFNPSATAGGFSTTFHLISAASTNATSVKASAGTIGNIVVSNGAAAARFLKIYNLAVAPTVGTSTPVLTLLVPAGQTVSVPFSGGMRLATGIALATTTGIAVADATAVALNDLAIHIDYI